MTINRNTPPTLQNLSDLKIVNPEKIELSNGTPCFFISGASEPILHISLITRAGTKYTDPKIAKITNSILSEGTTTYPSEIFSDTVDKYGAYLMNNVNSDIATLLLVTQTKFLEKTLPLIFSAMYEPELRAQNISARGLKFYNSCQEALRMNSYLAEKSFLPMTFGEQHPYSYTVNPNEYRNIDPNKVKKFHQQNYDLSNGYLLVVGGYNNQHKKIIIEMAEKYAQHNYSPIDTQDMIPITSPGLTKITNPYTHQAHVCMGFSTIKKGHPDYISLKIVTTLLGGFLGSRLMQNIREKLGYTYDIYATLSSYEQAGLFKIASDVKSDKAYQVEKEIRKQIKHIHNEPISNNELQRLKNYLQGEILSSFDGIFARQTSFMTTYNYGLGLDYFQKINKTLKTITNEEIMRISQKYLDLNNFATVIVEPRK